MLGRPLPSVKARSTQFGAMGLIPCSGHCGIQARLVVLSATETCFSETLVGRTGESESTPFQIRARSGIPPEAPIDRDRAIGRNREQLGQRTVHDSEVRRDAEPLFGEVRRVDVRHGDELRR